MELLAFFAPLANVAALGALPSGTGLAAQGATAVAALKSCTIQVCSSDDDEKDNAARIGETKYKLYLIDGEPDWKAGTMKSVSYPTLSSSFELVLTKARSDRSAMFRSLLQRHLDKIKEKDVTSIFSTKASLHVVQQAMATAILLRNLQPSKVTELHADTKLLDGTAFFEQIDMNHVERHRKLIQGYESQEAKGGFLW